MTTQIKSVAMLFNPYSFARAVNYARENAGVTWAELDELVGKSVSPQLRATMPNNTKYTSTPYHPTMRTYQAICNVLDLDPRAYFFLSDQ